VWRKGTPEEVAKILPEVRAVIAGVSDWTKAGVEQAVAKFIADKGYTVGSVLWPLRVSLSGQQNSPGPYEIAEVLGQEESLRVVSRRLLFAGSLVFVTEIVLRGLTQVVDQILLEYRNQLFDSRYQSR
jgi:hypothetical protein